MAVVGQTDSCIAAKCVSLDHLVSARKQCWRDGEAERFRRPEVEEELDFCGLHYGQFARSFPLEHSSDMDASQAIGVREVGSVAHQASGRSELSPLVDCRSGTSGRQRAELFAPAAEQRVWGDHESACP